MSNPVDEYLEIAPDLEKTAGPGSYVKGVLSGAKGTFKDPTQVGNFLTQSAALAGAGMLVGAARKAYSAATKSSDFRAMLELNPDLNEHQEANPKRFNQYYNSLRNLNPTFAGDPVVAGNYMRKMVEEPLHAGGQLIHAYSATRPGGNPLQDLRTGLDITSRAAPMPQKSEDLRKAFRDKLDLEEGSPEADRTRSQYKSHLDQYIKSNA